MPGTTRVKGKNNKMPRLPRISIENILYYVTSKGANEQNLFNDEKDYRTYLELLLNKRKEENNFKLFAFTLLSNHLHLLIELKAGANISEIMQNLNTLYTKYYNSRYKKKGAVFHQRYKATYVEKEPNLLELTRYIHLSARKLNLVSAPKDYHYSSYSLYTQIGADGKLRTVDLQGEIHEVLGRLKGKAYQEFVAEVPSGRMETLHKVLHRGGFLGSEEFVERIKGEIHARSEKGGKEEEFKEDIKGEIKEEVKAAPFLHKAFVLAGSTAVLVFGIVTFYLYSENSRLAKAYKIVMQEREVMVQQGEEEIKEGLIAQLATLEEAKEVKKLKAPVRTQLTSLNLDGSVWEIKLILTSRQGSEVIYEDKLVFENGKVTSYRLSSSGYPRSNYSVTVRDDGTLIWETMQTRQDGRTATWYGEWTDGIMKGILSQRLAEEKSQDFSFVSARRM